MDILRTLFFFFFFFPLMNILVYDDQGASPNSVKHTVATLKQLLGHAYDILQVNATVLQSQPWEVNCAMLVMPGGRDLPYCHALNGESNQRIKAYVSQGGRYLGLCAGAYYGSAEIEFEKDKAMDICEPRELGFFPGLSRGTAFPGFVYNSESGARSVTVKVYQLNGLPKEVKMYYNGGGYFVDPEKYDNVTVLCRFKERQDEEAAAVHCKIGKGHALLIATHPEYDISSSDLLLLDQASQTVTGIINDLIESEPDRKRLLRACFERIGLNVVPLTPDNIVDENKIPDTTPVYIAGFSKEWIHQPVISLLHKADRRTKLVEDAADLFCITNLDDNKNRYVDLLSACRKREEKSDIVHLVYDEGISEPIHPPSSLTPFFDIATYFNELAQRRKEGVWKIGNGVLYGQVMTSTQSLLER
jgi:biotin--protein ligase